MFKVLLCIKKNSGICQTIRHTQVINLIYEDYVIDKNGRQIPGNFPTELEKQISSLCSGQVTIVKQFNSCLDSLFLKH